MADKIDAIDGMRGISMLYIVGFWHLGEYHSSMSGMLNDMTLRLTVVLLALFVLISGYLAGMPIGALSAKNLRKYFIGKFKKVVVPFYLVLPIFWLCHILGGWAVIKAALLLSIVVPPAPPTLWFVLMIVVFYLLVPLVHFLMDSVKPILVWLGFLLACVVFGAFFEIFDKRLLLYMPIFIFGMMLGRQRATKPPSPISGLLAAGVFLASGWVSLNFNQHPERSVESIPMAMSGAWLIWCVFFRHWDAAPKLLKKMASSMAACSYFLYLIHRPVYDLASQQLQVLTSPAKYLLLMFIAAFLAAKIFQLFFERWIEPAVGVILSR